jgi:hypothetical protein
VSDGGTFRYQFDDEAEILCIWNCPSWLNTRMTGRAELDSSRDAAAAWPVVVRVAGLAAVVVAVLALALERFVGIGPVPLLALAGAVALFVGLQLPAAAPAFLQPLEPLDVDVDELS